MKRTTFLFGFLWLFLAGCTGEQRHRQIVFWCSNNAPEIIFAKEFVGNWNKQHPDTPIHYQPIPEGQSSEEIILASVVGHTTPDIYSNMWQGLIEMYAKAGVLIPLDTLRGFKEFLYTRCDSSVIREITSTDGHIYQVPWKVNPFMVNYSKKAMASIGYKSVPATYSAYFEAGKRFRKDLNHDGYTDQWLGYTEVKAIWYQRLFNFYPLYLAASGGAPLIIRNRAAFNNRYAVEVFRFLQQLYREDYFSKEKLSAAQDPFISEKIALQFSGPWQIGYLEKFKNKGFEYDFGQMPVPDDHTGPTYTYCDPKNIVIFNTCRDPQRAWDFIKTMIDKPGDLRLMEITGQFPRRQHIDTDAYFSRFLQQNPRLVPFARQARYIRGVDNCEVMVEVFDIISQEYEACVIYGKKSPEDAVRDAAQAVDVLLGN